MTITSLLPRQLVRTADAIGHVSVRPWSGGALHVDVHGDWGEIVPLALEACDASLELEDGHEARVALRRVGRRLTPFRRYQVSFHNLRDLPRVRFRGGAAGDSTVLALDLTCPVTGASFRFPNAAMATE